MEIKGKDGKTHSLTTDVSSTFDAVEKAIHTWCRLWWWDPDTIAIVRVNEISWSVPVPARYRKAQPMKPLQEPLQRSKTRMPTGSPMADNFFIDRPET